MEKQNQEAVPELSGRMGMDLKTIVKAVMFWGLQSMLGMKRAVRGMHRQKSAPEMPMAAKICGGIDDERYARKTKGSVKRYSLSKVRTNKIKNERKKLRKEKISNNSIDLIY